MKLNSKDRERTKNQQEKQLNTETMQLDSVVSFRLKNSELMRIKAEASEQNRTISNYLKTKLNINDK